MIFNGFDGVNLTLTMSPRELKTMYLALDQLQQPHHKVIADRMNLDGFTLTTADVFSLLRSAQLSIDGISNNIKGQLAPETKEAVENKEAEDAQVVKPVKRTLN